jgi:phosphoacetylglucosamine mutase
MEEVYAKVVEADANYRNEGHFTYGTSGFRTVGATLHRVSFRSILVLAYRCMQTSKYTGMMITASHNPKEDNGMKLIDSNGECLAAEWEGIAEEVVNSEDLKATMQKYFPDAISANIIVGFDTRETSPELAAAARACLEAIGATFTIFERYATP